MTDPNLHLLPVTFPLATSSWGPNERAAIQRVVDSDRYTMGPEVGAFEEEFAAHFGAKYAVMVNSGSSANLVAVAAAVLSDETRLQAGDEVLVPAVSWSTTYYPLHQYGLRLKFVDIDPLTLNMDLDLARAAIGPRTRAIMAVNLLGNPNDFTTLEGLCTEFDLVLLEDNCESMGAEFDGRAAGTFGVMGSFSTFFSHHISTMEGGVVLTDSERFAQMMKSIRAHGWTRELPIENLVHSKSGDAFEDLFQFVLPGYNVRPLEMSGAIGREQLKQVPALVAGRRANAALFADRFAGRHDVSIQREVGRSSWFGFSLVLQEHLNGRRTDVVRALAAVGIESRPIVAGNFTRNPVISRLDAIVPDSLPAADKIHFDGLFVGNHHYPIDAQLDRLVGVFDRLAQDR
ncbi:MAG: DegT/DnrJ/EryC1/StrS family aminotransferase [Cellulomonas sp.]